MGEDLYKFYTEEEKNRLSYKYEFADATEFGDKSPKYVIVKEKDKSVYIFFRLSLEDDKKEVWYPVSCKDDEEAINNAYNNIGTVRVENMEGKVVWPRSIDPAKVTKEDVERRINSMPIQPKLRIHLIFCCSTYCLKKELSQILMEYSKEDIKVNYNEAEKIVIINDEDEYRFISHVITDREMFCGMHITDYRSCINYELDPSLVAILESHKRPNTDG